MKRNKYSAIKTLKTFQWLLLFAFTTSFAIGARTGNDLNIFTGEVQASAVLESPSQEDNTIVEATPLTPTPSPTTTVTQPISVPLAVEAVDPSGGEAELEELIKEYFGEHSEDAFKVLDCENKTLNPRAVNYNRNGSKDLGLFQLNDRYWGGEENFDPETNIKKARMIFDRAGGKWTPWTCAYRANQKSYLHQ